MKHELPSKLKRDFFVDYSQSSYVGCGFNAELIGQHIIIALTIPFLYTLFHQ